MWLTSVMTDSGSYSNASVADHAAGNDTSCGHAGSQQLAPVESESRLMLLRRRVATVAFATTCRGVGVLNLSAQSVESTGAYDARAIETRMPVRIILQPLCRQAIRSFSTYPP